MKSNRPTSRERFTGQRKSPKLLHSNRNTSGDDRNQDSDHQDAKLVAVLYCVGLEENAYEVDRRQRCQAYGLQLVGAVRSIGQVRLMEHEEEQGNQRCGRNGHRRFRRPKAPDHTEQQLPCHFNRFPNTNDRLAFCPKTNPR